MLIVTTDYITGKDLEMLGLVKGSTIQTKNVGRDISQSFKTLVGGELKSYNEMMNDAAIVGVRYASAAIMQGAAEAIAYGTAVKFI